MQNFFRVHIEKRVVRSIEAGIRSIYIDSSGDDDTMGSLMSGWSSSVLSDKEGTTIYMHAIRSILIILSLLLPYVSSIDHSLSPVYICVCVRARARASICSCARLLAARLMRNRSLTKEEVAAFWRRQQHSRKPENGEAAAAAGFPPPLVAGSPRAVRTTRTAACMDIYAHVCV